MNSETYSQISKKIKKNFENKRSESSHTSKFIGRFYIRNFGGQKINGQICSKY